MVQSDREEDTYVVGVHIVKELRRAVAPEYSHHTLSHHSHVIDSRGRFGSCCIYIRLPFVLIWRE